MRVHAPRPVYVHVCARVCVCCVRACARGVCPRAHARCADEPPPSDDDFSDKFGGGGGGGGGHGTDDKWAAPEFGGSSWGDGRSHIEELDSSPALPGLNQPLGGGARDGARRMPSAPKAEGSLVGACASQVGIASFFGIMMGCASGAIIGPLSERSAAPLTARKPAGAAPTRRRAAPRCADSSCSLWLVTHSVGAGGSPSGYGHPVREYPRSAL